MTPEQYKLREEIKGLALPDKPPTPTSTSCTVESLANELVRIGECRRTAACALCTLSGLDCAYLEAYVQRHDGMGLESRTVDNLRGNGAGFAG